MDIELGKKLYQELNELGSSEEIYETLKAQGVKAMMNKEYSCAISQYVRMRTELNYGDVRTEDFNFRIYSKGTVKPVYSAEHSEAMGEFIDNFDSYEYPELVIYSQRED